VSGRVLGELHDGLVVETVVLSVEVRGEGLRRHANRQERRHRKQEQGNDAADPHPRTSPDKSQHQSSSIFGGAASKGLSARSGLTLKFLRSDLLEDGLSANSPAAAEADKARPSRFAVRRGIEAWDMPQYRQVLRYSD